jgi:Uma2 family endonuclease
MSAPTTSAPRPTHERHRFTGEDVLAMQRAGLLLEAGKFELIDGEIIDMPAEGSAHLELKAALTRHLNRVLSDDVGLVPDGTLRLAERVWPEPDLYLYPASKLAADVRGPDTLLVIEIADTTQRYDLGTKAALYRQYGVREYWVLDVVKRESHVHLMQEVDAWPTKPRPFEDVLTPSLLGGLTVRIADLERKK